MGYRVAVVGGTGNVGREMLSTLAERDFPADEVVPLASERSTGVEVSYGEEKVLKVRRLDATIHTSVQADRVATPNPVERQLGMLKAAFGTDY